MGVSNLPAHLQQGRLLLTLPQFNKGTSFTRKERVDRRLLGLLPYCEESLAVQVDRAYQAYSEKPTNLERHIYLRQLQDLNENLFFQLIIDNADEMLPVIYTPTVGAACEYFSEIYRRPRGLFLSYPERDMIETAISNVRTDSIEVIVITDGEAILGLGDQGVGGMGIPIGKLSLYSALGGIHPITTLPIALDVGTNNQKLLDNDLYVGWKHERIQGDEYYEFLETALASIHRRWPDAVIQFEDFGASNSQRILDNYIDRICCFNDDIQGTAAVTVGSLIAACRVTGNPICDSRIVVVGAGAAGTGIAKGCADAMINEGLDHDSAHSRIYLMNSKGLIHDGSERIRSGQKAFVKRQAELSGWEGDFRLLDTVRNVRPDILIGVSGQKNYFTEELVKLMCSTCDRPCIFPLSNPTDRTEALPSDLLEWSNGKAIVATGSPFDPIEYDGVVHNIAQCNNAYAFPGIGLGLISVKARKVTNEMFTAAATVIGHSQSNVSIPGSSLLPPLTEIRALSREIAIAVADIAVRQGVAATDDGRPVEQLVDEKIWHPADDVA
ncbi:MAG: NAD-dependent malic enzyme [Acidiferrobacterales bacterium]|nr:NAD-dependent malic enzyme [Acidiferrobacterales bacterium]